MPRGRTTKQYVGMHVKDFSTHSVTIDLESGAHGVPAGYAARRLYVTVASTSATIQIRTEVGAVSTMPIATGEQMDVVIRKILPPSKFGSLKIYW